MAMRPAKDRAATPSRPWVGVQPVYEDFRPMSEWLQDEESDLLLLFLPGFLRQHLKVSTEGKNIVRVRGERLVAGNKWSRFQEDYQVPEKCNIRAVRARFEGGILTITMPRKENQNQERSNSKEAAMTIPPKSTTVSSPDDAQKLLRSPPKEPKQSITQKGFDDSPKSSTVPSPSPDDAQKLLRSPPKEPKQSMSQKGFDDALPPKVLSSPPPPPPPPTPPPTPTTAGSSDKGKDEKRFSELQTQKGQDEKGKPKQFMPQMGFDDTPPKVLSSPPTITGSSEKGINDEKRFSEPQTQKGQDEKRDKLALTPPKTETPMTSINETIKRKEDAMRSGEMKGKSTKLENLESSKGDQTDDYKKGNDEKIKAEKIAKETAADHHHEEKEKQKQKQKQTQITITAVASSSASTDHYGLVNYKQTMKSLPELNEERQLLVNVGVAVLVIVALGTYVTCALRSGEA